MFHHTGTILWYCTSQWVRELCFHVFCCILLKVDLFLYTPRLLHCPDWWCITKHNKPACISLYVWLQSSLSITVLEHLQLQCLVKRNNLLIHFYGTNFFRNDGPCDIFRCVDIKMIKYFLSLNELLTCYTKTHISMCVSMQAKQQTCRYRYIYWFFLVSSNFHFQRIKRRCPGIRGPSCSF